MTTRALTLSRYRLIVLLAAAVLPLLGGCGKEQATSVVDVTALLASMEQDRRRHDPHAYSEVDLGEFAVTWRQKPDDTGDAEAKVIAEEDLAALIIRFHLYAVVADSEVADCQTLLETHGERVRSKVREVVQGSKSEQLKDPTLGWLKSDLIQSINQSLQAPLLRDVAFAQFALDGS